MDSKPKRALLIDSRASFRNALCDTLREAGYEVELSRSGPDAIEKIRDVAFDILIIDLGSFGPPGVDLYLTALDAAPEMEEKVLFIVGGHPEDSTVKAYLEKLAPRRLERPFGADLFLETASILTSQSKPYSRESRERLGDRRGEKRFKWEEDCRVTGKSASGPIPFASTVDISRNGVKIRYLGMPVKSDLLVEVEIRQIKVKGAGMVAWSKTAGDMEAVSGIRLFEPIEVSSILSVIQAGRWRTA